jgi:hypothetical protein
MLLNQIEIAKSRQVQNRPSTVGPDRDVTPVEAGVLRYAQFKQCRIAAHSSSAMKLVRFAKVRN